MNSSLATLARGVTMTGDLRADMTALLRNHGCEKTIVHSLQVASEAKRLAERWHENPFEAEVAGWLHDISAIIPDDQRLAFAEGLGLDILPGERVAPMIIHQKLSAAIALELFGVQSETVLSAIGCHTTLKANASGLDKVLFVADKISWDQPGDPPYLEDMVRALKSSLDCACCAYLGSLMQRRHELPVLHPWAEAAYNQLCVA